MYNNLGIGLYGGEHSPLEPAHKVIDILLASIYEPVGIDWFNWFCYENDFGEEHLGAFENDGRDVGESLHVVYIGWLSQVSFYRWERRLVGWLAPLTFH